MKIIIRLKPARLITTAIALTLPYISVSATIELNAINVTATRTAQTVDETLAAVTVITRDDIDKLQDQDLVELLDGLPGLTISSNGGLGKSTGIRLRGTGSGHVLVLIDGVRIGSATQGQTSFEHLPLAQIDRIEIVRGPVSHLYGADAIGGVIQIFTRKGQGRQINAEAGYGSYNTSNNSLSISEAHNNTAYSLGISQLKSDGFSTRKGSNPDKDGYRNQSVTAQLSHRFSSNLKLGVNILHADGNSEYDGWSATKDYSVDFVQQSISGKLEYSPTAWWDLSLSLGETKDESTDFTNGSRTSFFDTKQHQRSWQNSFFISDQSILTLGMDFLRDKVDVSNTYSEDKRDNSGYFIQYQKTVGANNFILALRHDDSDAFENSNTGNIAWGYKISEDLQLNTSYGTAFAAPTFNDLYYSSYPGGSSGNPDLTPEKSKSIELGLKGRQAWGSWQLNAFRTSIIGLISWHPISPGSWAWRPRNISKARIKGLEASINSTLAGWDIAGNLTMLDPRDTTTKKQLVQRHKRTLRIDASRNFDNSNIGATFRARSYSYKDDDNNQRVGGFGTLDLRASHQLTSSWQIKAEISNLFDKEYETIKGYNTEGRTIFTSIAYQSK